MTWILIKYCNAGSLFNGYFADSKRRKDIHLFLITNDMTEGTLITYRERERESGNGKRIKEMSDELK